MLSIFRTNQLLASILLGFYILLLRVPAHLFYEYAPPTNHGLLADQIYQYIGHDTLTAQIVAMLLLLIQAFYLNVLVSEHRLVQEVSLFPGLFYILVASLLPEFNYLSPILMANTFFIVALGAMLNTYKKIGTADRIFNVGFWLSVGSLFYASYVVLLIFALASLNILRKFRIREALMVLVGYLVPQWLIGAYLFWQGRLEEAVRFQWGKLTFLHFETVEALSLYRSIGIFLLLLLVVLFSQRLYLFKQGMDAQRKISVVFWVLLVVAMTLLVQYQIGIEHLQILALPLGILLSINFIKMPPRIAEVIHLLVLAGAILLQCLPQLW